MIDEKAIPPPAYVTQPTVSQPQPILGSNVSYPPPVGSNMSYPSHSNISYLPPAAGMSGQPQYQHPPQGPSAAELGAHYQNQLFARCAQGLHDPTTKYGVFGVITAVLLFPIGLICLFADTERRCARCGIALDR